MRQGAYSPQTRLPSAIDTSASGGLGPFDATLDPCSIRRQTKLEAALLRWGRASSRGQVHRRHGSRRPRRRLRDGRQPSQEGTSLEPGSRQPPPGASRRGRHPRAGCGLHSRPHIPDGSPPASWGGRRRGRGRITGTATLFSVSTLGTWSGRGLMVSSQMAPPRSTTRPCSPRTTSSRSPCSAVADR